MSRAASRSASNSGSAVDRLRPLVDEAGADVAERLLQLRVGERALGVLLEGGRGDFHRFSPPRRSAACSVMPASTSATWRACDRDALALQLAGHVHQAAEIAGEQRARRRSRRSPRSSCSTMALEMSGYLTQNVPPKPQQTSASCSSASFRPATDLSRRRGWSRTPSSRRPEQES